MTMRFGGSGGTGGGTTDHDALSNLRDGSGAHAHLNTTQVAALSAAQITSLLALSTTQINLLTSAQINTLSGMTTTQAIGLTTANISYLATTSTQLLTTTQVSQVSAAAATTLTTTQFNALNTTTIAALTTTNMAGLTGAVANQLTTTQVAGLAYTTQLQSLTTTQMASINTAGIAALTTSAIKALIETQISQLTNTQVGTFTTTQLQGLTSTQFASIPTAAISGLTTTQMLHIPTMAAQTANAVAITGGTVEGLTSLGVGVTATGGSLIQVRGPFAKIGSLTYQISIWDTTATAQNNGSGIRFAGQYTGGDVDFGGISCCKSSATGADGGGYMAFHTTATGDSTPLERMRIKQDGAVTMNKYGSGAATFDASGNITSVSDERLKDIQGAFTDSLAAISGINPILYKYNESSGLETGNVYAGFSAQNVKQFIPKAVGVDKSGYYSLNDMPILAAMVNAIKELKSEIDELKNKLEMPLSVSKMEPIEHEDLLVKFALAVNNNNLT